MMTLFARQFFFFVLAAVIAGCGPQPPKESAVENQPTATNAAGQPSNKIELVANSNMRFDRNLIEVPANQKITLRLRSDSRLPKEAMAHNLVVLDLGTDVNAFMVEATFAQDSDYIPEAYRDAIIAQTSLLGPGDSETITFRAPKKPGEYVFLCTFPGHAAAGMKGIMRVVVVTEM